MADIGLVLPIADGEAGEIGCSQGGRFGDDGAADRRADDVGLELHQAVVQTRAAIHVTIVSVISLAARSAVSTRKSAHFSYSC